MNKIICLTPVFNDWESLSFLINDIESISKENPDYNFSIVAVNDGSSEDSPNNFENTSLDIKLIDLKLNVGHQRAIAIGIQYISNEIIDHDIDQGHIVILDSDGEDKPSDIMPMVQKSINKVVFAKRTKRSEGYKFKLGYFFYKTIFKSLTGKTIDYGNFSVVPFSIIQQVAILPNIWNHYAGSITQSKIKRMSYPTERGIRYAGKSKMNISSLIIHGFSSISIYFDILCFRVLKFSFIGILICSIGVGYVLFQKLFTDNAIPGWASSLILIVLSIVIQLFSITFIVLLVQLRTRKEITSPNLEQYRNFIKT